MALDNYANLKAAVEGWSHRQDIGGYIDDFIDICEKEFYQGNSVRLRTRDMNITETSAMSASVRTQALPTNYLETIRFDVTNGGERRTIDYRTPEQTIIRSGTGTPKYYTITDQIEYDIQPDTALVTNIVHYARLNALDSTNTTNAILTNYPNVYLYGCLWALFQWARNSEEEQKFYAKFLEAIAGANSSGSDGSYGVSMQKIRRGRNP